tara:strand:+ start:10640 stop:12325 length:1686 start_codon:yes stop_codon:yes gene_type:complete
MIKFTFKLLNAKQKINFFLLLILAVFVACLELLGIFSIFPFLSVIENPKIIKENIYLLKVFNFFNFKNEQAFIQFLGICVILLFLIRGIFSISLTALKMVFTRFFHKDLTFRLFQHYLNLEYLEFKKKKKSSSSEVLVNETLYVSNSITDLVTFITELILIILIFTALMVIDWKITLFSISVLAFLGVFTIPITKSLSKVGIERAETQLKIFDTISETMNVFKGIKILSAIQLFKDRLTSNLKTFAKNQIYHGVLGEIPRYFIEITAVSFIMVSILILYDDGNNTSWVPVISTLAISFYRLLPSINRLINSYNQLKYNKRASNLILEEFKGKIEVESTESIPFENQIVFKDISLSYGSKKILDKVNLKINRGEKIALVGPSGSGKTTFLDIFMGLIKPDNGDILVDNRPLNSSKVKSWRSKVGYLPQENYLLNASIEENILFGRKKDNLKLENAIKLSFLDKDSFFEVESKNTIGDSGNKLSGGQKQRLMIARLAYGEPDILILDEPTSALDSENEEKIMNEVFNSFKNKTILVVSHRDKAINGCERSIKICDGKVKEINE